jgi:Domain of Unknown Function (DUF1080)
MDRGICGILISVAFALIGGGASSQKATVPARTFRLDSLDGLGLVNAKAEISNYRGRGAVHLVPLPGHEAGDEMMMAILKDSDFTDGTIEAEVAGAPRAGAAPDQRGFIGILFRVQQTGLRAEDFYLRPTNGRSDDQLRRNHSVQYESAPDFPWYRLRKENPGVYESYADLQAGAWTKMKIVVSGTRARLYINGAEQPCLVVNDLKNGETHGQIGIWAHASTEGYFSTLTVK